MDWDKLRVFHEVAEIGSLTHAGDVLDMNQSTVSRQVRALEDSISATLFHRHARGLVLTEQGERLHRSTSRILKEIELASAQIKDTVDKPVGEIRVTTTTGFGTLWLSPRIANFYSRYPDLKINLMLSERVLDLSMREADVAIRMKEPSRADLIRRRLMSVRIRLYATDSYLSKHGSPANFAGLPSHTVIYQAPAYAGAGGSASFVNAVLSLGISSYLVVNNYYGVLQAVLHDLGIGLLPDYLKVHFPRLQRVLPGVESGELPVYLAFPRELRKTMRIRAFREFVIEEVAAYRRESR